MIAEYLDRPFVISQLRDQRGFLIKLRKLVAKKDKATLASLKKNKIKPAQIDLAIAELARALALAKKDKSHADGAPFIPRDAVTCSLQAGLTQLASRKGKVRARKDLEPASTKRRAVKSPSGEKGPQTAARLELKEKPGAHASAESLRRAAFVEGDDVHYGLDGFFAKFGALFTRRRKFNKNPARTAKSSKPLRLFIFGDWGTGLPLANAVTQRIGEQIAEGGSDRAHHVIHLGDVYYVGKEDEYIERVFPSWPVAMSDRKKVGSWSLNGNHDMYEGGHGYFDTLLAEPRFLTWHADSAGQPSSFFLIEDGNWQVFGLDTSWNAPSAGKAIFGKPTLKDAGGMNGFITEEQAEWMAQVRNPAKGCILLTHHQPAASRTSEKQHADQTIALLQKAKVYHTIDAWLWGHEHRAVVFRPKIEREDLRLANAPEFCACIGHGGVPVTDKNFEATTTIADVLWQEDGEGLVRPYYEDEKVMPFGFARIETEAGKFDFRIFDHDGNERYAFVFTR